MSAKKRPMLKNRTAVYLPPGAINPRRGKYMGKDETGKLMFRSPIAQDEKRTIVSRVEEKHVLSWLDTKDSQPEVMTHMRAAPNQVTLNVHPHVTDGESVHPIRDGHVLNKPAPHDVDTADELEAMFDGKTLKLMLENRHPKRRVLVTLSGIQNPTEVKRWLMGDQGLTCRQPVVAINCETDERTFKDPNWPMFSVKFSGPYSFEQQELAPNERI